MERCAKLLVDEAGNVQRVIQQISCNAETITEYPNWFIWGGGVVVFLFLWFTFIFPFINIWLSKKSGLATLAEAENAEKVAIAQANARIGAAKANKEAEIIEAEAVAESIAKIGDALQNNPSYNVFQWIKMMEKKPDASVIYVPTEANLPIMEAMRFASKKPVQTDSDEK